MNRRWMEVLPSPYKTDKPIVALLIPTDWKFMEGSTKDNRHNLMAVVSKDEEKARGLQFMDSNLRSYDDHRKRFAEYAIPTLTPAYVGPLSLLPQRLLMDEDMTVMVFHRDDFWRRPIDLKRAWRPAETRC